MNQFLRKKCTPKNQFLKQYRNSFRIWLSYFVFCDFVPTDLSSYILITWGNYAYLV